MARTLGIISAGIAFVILIVFLVATNVTQKREREQKDREKIEARLRELDAQQDRLLATVSPRIMGQFRKQVKAAIAEYKQRTGSQGDPTGTSRSRLRRDLERARQEALEQSAERTTRAEEFMDKWQEQLDSEQDRLLREAGITLEDQ